MQQPALLSSLAVSQPMAYFAERAKLTHAQVAATFRGDGGDAAWNSDERR